MSSDADHVSAIELDLMKSYVRELYETLLNLPTGHAGPKVEVIRTQKVEIAESKPRPTPPPPPAVKPESAAEMEQEVVLPPPPKEPPVAPAAVKPDSEISAPARIVTRPPVSPELEELFRFETAKELSEKLSEMPISDIRKAMGLNERIFTVNELFGGEKEVFDTTIAELNKMNSFEEAKAYLINGVAAKYNWSAKNLKNKAKAFIKLVKRRYN